MVKASELVNLENFYFHGIFHGVAGSGKTVAAGSFPKPLFLDFDHGTTSLAALPWADQIEVEHFDSLTKLEQKLREIGRKCEYKTLVFDSTTVLETLILDHYARMNGHLDPTGRPNEHCGLLEYGQRIHWLRWLTTMLLQQPFHTILISHSETLKDEVLGTIETRPAVPGKLFPSQFPGLASEVYRFEILHADSKKPRGPHVNVSLVGSGRYVAKSRLQKLLDLPPVIQLTWGDSLYEKLTEKLAEKLAEKLKKEGGATEKEQRTA